MDGAALIDLPISHTAYNDLLDTLTRSHMMRIDVRIKNNEEKTIHSLSHPDSKILSGSVQIDANADITRTLDLTFLDPDGKLRFEAASPAHGALFVDRFVAVRYEVWVPPQSRWESIPIFWGPLSSYERDGAEVAITAIGKESLLGAGDTPHFMHKGFTLDRGTTIKDAIRKVADRMGESRYRIPRLHTRLDKPRIVDKQANPWDVIAGGKTVDGFTMRIHKHKPHDGWRKHQKKHKTVKAPGLVRMVEGDYTAFYNGKGELCVRELNKKPCYRFKWGRDLITRPNLAYDVENFRNEVEVTGKPGKGHSQPPVATAWLPPGNPLSAHALGRNNIPRWYTEYIQADNLETEKKCREHAVRVLKHMSSEGVDISFDALPIPMLEEDDWVEVQTLEYRFKFRVKALTIPLVADEAMSVGYHKHVSPRKHKRKHPGGPRTSGTGRHRHHMMHMHHHHHMMGHHGMHHHHMGHGHHHRHRHHGGGHGHHHRHRRH